MSQVSGHSCDLCSVKDGSRVRSIVMQKPFCLLSPGDQVASSPDGVHFGGFSDVVAGEEDGSVYLFMWHGWMSKLPRSRVATKADWVRAVDAYF